MRAFGLIGRPLSHSFSQRFFTRKFEQAGIADCRYQNYELRGIEELTGLLDTVPTLEGLNVTIPYKEQVLSFLDEMDPVVQAIGACNCIKISGGRLIGFNTDATGFTRALQPFLKPWQTKALVLGNGGASKAVQYALAAQGITFKVVSRRADDGQISYETLNDEWMEDHTLIINTTPLGTFPDVASAPPIPYGAIGDRHLLFDLVYNPEVTTFLRRGAERGAQTSNGYQMLVEQAEESWAIWNKP